MTSRLAGLTGATLETAPTVCQTCVWWQTRGNREPEKRKWIDRAEDEWGAWGTVYRDDDVHGRDVEIRHAPEVLGDALLHLTRHRIRARPPLELEMHDHACRLGRARDLRGVAGQSRDTRHLSRRVTRISGEDLG